MKTEETRIPWCLEDVPKEVLGLLNDHETDSSRFVGGCVRNHIMEVDKSLDLDIATKFEPEKVTEIMERAGLQVIQSGTSHGTVTAVCDGESFEITTLRKDVATDGRHAVVKFTDDWLEDAKRRDFTFNALYYDGVQTVYDPTDKGIDDARERRVTFIGDANERLREDYLRILRFFRLNAQFELECYEEGLRACNENRLGLKMVSKERIWKEFRALLRRSANPYYTLVKMYDSGVLGLVLPGIDKRKLQSRPIALRDCGTSGVPDELQKVMSLIPRSEVVVEEIAVSLRLSNVFRKRLIKWAKCEADIEEDRSEEDWQKLVTLISKEGFYDRVFGSATEKDAGKWKKLIESISNWEIPAFPINGRDMANVGFVERQIGQILKDLKEIWIDGGFRHSSKQLIDIARQRYLSKAI